MEKSEHKIHQSLPYLFLHLLLLPEEASMLLLEGFHHLLMVLQRSVLSGHSTLLGTQSVASALDGLLIIVEPSQAQLHTLLLYIVKHVLVFFSLGQEKSFKFFLGLFGHCGLLSAFSLLSLSKILTCQSLLQHV